MFDLQVAAGGGNSALLSNVMDELVGFRTKVRNYALAVPEAADTVQTEEGAMGSKGPKQEQKEKRQKLMQERKPLLEACDGLRGNLAAFGIHIKVDDSYLPCEAARVSKAALFMPFLPPQQLSFLHPASNTATVAGGRS